MASNDTPIADRVAEPTDKFLHPVLPEATHANAMQANDSQEMEEGEDDDVPAEQDTKQKLDPCLIGDFNSRTDPARYPLPKFIKEITNFDPVVTKPPHDLSTSQGRDAALAQLEDFISLTSVSRPAIRVLHQWKSQVSSHSMLAMCCQFATDSQFYCIFEVPASANLGFCFLVANICGAASIRFGQQHDDNIMQLVLDSEHPSL